MVVSCVVKALGIQSTGIRELVIQLPFPVIGKSTTSLHVAFAATWEFQNLQRNSL